MIGAVYGLQVHQGLRQKAARTADPSTGCHLHPQARVHAYRVDVCLHCGVGFGSTQACIGLIVQVPDLLGVPPDLLFLVDG